MRLQQHGRGRVLILSLAALLAAAEAVEAVAGNSFSRASCQRADGSDGVFCPRARRCIEPTRVCDGVMDCWDRSDEDHCSECQPGVLLCPAGRCVAALYVCDGHPHCPGGEDEANCTAAVQLYSCLDNTTRRLDAVCDGHQDCERPDDDEGGCGACRSGALLCEGVCIRAALLCDGVPDCKDGSDEDRCEARTAPTTRSPDEDKDSGETAALAAASLGHSLCWLSSVLTVLAMGLVGGAAAAAVWWYRRRRKCDSRRIGLAMDDFGETPFESPMDALAFDFRAQEPIYQEPTSRDGHPHPHTPSSSL